MEPLKAKYTRWLFYLATKFPWFFSKRIRYLVSTYAGPESDYIKGLYKDEDCITSANLFRGDVKWKGVSLIAAMGRSDLTRIHKWMNSQNGSPGNYNASHEKGINSTNLVGSAFNNLGLVSFDRPNMFAVCSISIVAELPQSCYVTLLRLKNGVSYLSLYISLDEGVEKKITRVDVSGVKRYKCFQSVNPFSHRFSVVEHHERRNVIEEKIYGNARDVVSQARQAASALLQVWGVKKSILDFATLADFFREGSGSYFDDEATRENDEQPVSLTVVEPWNGFFCSPISDDVSENYIENYVPEKIGVDAIFIKSQETSLVERGDRYIQLYNGVRDYYAYMLMLAEIYSQFKSCMRKVSPIFFKYKNSVRADLKTLLRANLALNLIDERLGAVEEGLHWSDKKYWQHTRNRILGIRSQVVALRTDVERRKSLTDGELQLTNLIWMRRYSIIVFVLVLVQIALSVLNVDWTEDGRSRNPMYLNLFSEKK